MSGSHPDELRRGARVFVEDWAKVEPGERVLVLADDTTDREVARAVLDSARATGADVTFLELAKPGSAWAEPSEVVLGAMKRAQKCLSMALVYHDRRTTIARREHGMSMFFLLPPVPATLTGAAAAFPIELCTEIGRRCALRLRAAREIRITSRRGTDFSATLDPRNCTADPGGWLEAWDPGRTVGTTPGEGSNTFPPASCSRTPIPARCAASPSSSTTSGSGRCARTWPSATSGAAASRRRGRAPRRSPRSSRATTMRPTWQSSPGGRTRSRR